MMSRREGELRLQDIDWQKWKPQQRATLVFVIRDGEILLIRKKKGLGAGKINAPGGRIGSGETPAEGAVREAQEELHVNGTVQMDEFKLPTGAAVNHVLTYDADGNGTLGDNAYILYTGARASTTSAPIPPARGNHTTCPASR